MFHEVLAGMKSSKNFVYCHCTVFCWIPALL